jgi:Wax ester synthase/diacylglycerol acyltransferase catalytic domain
VHHCAVDGISGMEALTLMLDLVPEPRKVPFPESPWTAEPVPDQLEMFGRGALGLVEHPRRVFRLVRSFQTLARPAGGAPGARPWLLHATSMPNTPVHTDAAIDGLRAAGIRALHCYGFFAATRDNPAFRTHEHRRADFARVARSHSSAGGLLKIGAALTEVGVLPWNDTVAEIQAAREAGARMVLHTGCVWGSVVTLGVKEMHGHRLLGPDQVHVHCNTLDDEEWSMLGDAGAKVSISPPRRRGGMRARIVDRLSQTGKAGRRHRRRRPGIACAEASCRSRREGRLPGGRTRRT